MRIVTLEEHVCFPDLVRQYLPGAGRHSTDPLAPQQANPLAPPQADPLAPPQADPLGSLLTGPLAPLLADVDGARLDAMDQHGITYQVLSVVGPGAEALEGPEGVNMARAYNDRLAAEIQHHPDRFGAFAHLPMALPWAAADELDRTVSEYDFKGALIKGMTQGVFLDDPAYAPLLERAARLDVPLYLHPGPPPPAVDKAYFSGLPKGAGLQLSLSGWGWHAETALHVLRLIVSGTFDKFPDLRIIIGHNGEMLPMMMARIDEKFKVGATGLQQRSVSRTLRDQVFVTTSGMFTLTPLQAAIDTFGIERVLFSVDYPFSTLEEGRRFLDGLPLDKEAKMLLAHANAERVLAI
ncbi:amidohydrolase family protein [Dinghuibacter silviterrae]|uniref:Amidohydrolase-related domain-containing protein n=1 Tax=Dinghuibacter silviterrae TaxID=1539049 RepID=A0A4R8DU22_9BACT|nr:amidohydrolase family protein [Dinghuibacter silviterrae]TDX01416.1 hypothetical protein EDB95_2451 [Dinghuibacter silviterrae]